MNLFIRKILMNGIVVVPMLMWLSEASFWGSLVTAVILSTLAYLIGDQVILRLSNNTIATIADIGLTFIYLWMVDSFMDWALSLNEIILISIAVGIVEIIFHRQLGEADSNRRIA